MKILVGYDGSNASKGAMEVARHYAKAFGATVHVAHSRTSGTEDDQEAINTAKSELEWARSFFRSGGVKSETHLLIRGMSPGEDLVRFAEENAVDQIVMGVKRRSKVSKILLGSTAQYVILKAPCPVVTVK